MRVTMLMMVSRCIYSNIVTTFCGLNVSIEPRWARAFCGLKVSIEPRWARYIDTRFQSHPMQSVVSVLRFRRNHSGVVN